MKLTPEQKRQRSNALAAAELRRTALVSAIETYNAAVRAAFEALEQAKTDHNEALAEVAESLHAIGEELRASIEEKSERWQEGDAGSAASDWASSYEDFAFEEWEPYEPEEIEAPDTFDETFEEQLALATEAP